MRHTSELLAFLRRSSQLIDQLTENAAERWQLSISEMRILLFLEQHPEFDTARDVATECGMSKASVSGNVLKLATRGLLTVDVDLKDRRFQHLTLTEQAAPSLQETREQLENLDSRLLEILDEQERHQFFSLLNKITSDPRFHTISSENRKD